MSSGGRLDRLELELLRSARREFGPTSEERRALRSAVLAQVGLASVGGVGEGGQCAEGRSAGVARPSGIRTAAPPQLELVGSAAGPQVVEASGPARSLAGLRFGWRVVTGATLGGILIGLGAGYFAFGGARADEAGPSAPALTARLDGPSLREAPPTLVLPFEEPSQKEEMTEPERLPTRGSTPAAPSAARSSAAVLPIATSGEALVQKADDALAPMSFYEELTYLRRAQAALRRNESALALGLMQSLDRLNTGGALLSERAMTKVLALCLLERPDEAIAAARSLVVAEGGALYVDRISHSCAAVAVEETRPMADDFEPSGAREGQTGDAASE